MKRFPRKSRNSEVTQDETKSSPSKSAGKSSKVKTKRARSNDHRDSPSSIKEEQSPLLSDANGMVQSLSPSSDKGAVEGAKKLSPRAHKNSSEELELSDTDLANVKFRMSPSEAMLYLQSASTTVPQLFKYDSLDSLSVLTPVQTPQENSIEGRTNVPSGRPVHSGRPVISTGPSGRHSKADGSAGDSEDHSHSFKRDAVVRVRLSAEDENPSLAKKLCVDGLEYWGTHPPPPPNGSLSTPPVTPLTPITPSHPHSHPPSRHHSPHSHPPSRHNTPEPMCANNLASYNSPYVTPHGTPAHTPLQSPISSPTLVSHPHHHLHAHPNPNSTLQGGVPVNTPSSMHREKLPGESWPQPGEFLTSSPSSMSHFNMAGVTSQLHLQSTPASTG